jgi:hypothetical protein
MSALLKGHGVEATNEQEMLAHILHQELGEAGQAGRTHRQLFYGVGVARARRQFHCGKITRHLSILQIIDRTGQQEKKWKKVSKEPESDWPSALLWGRGCASPSPVLLGKITQHLGISQFLKEKNSKKNF